MSIASSSCEESYNVFLNFRGKDTRNGFTAHLYKSLCDEKIRTFMDADKIAKGEEISPALVTAMDKSKFFIVVLSKNYASSTWCLDELVQSLKCKNAKKQTVLPIFYDVSPSDVREQKGNFAQAFAKLEEKFEEEMERVQIWKQALTEVANISGWDARYRHEPTLISEIIQCISDALINRSSKDVEAKVRVDSHLQVKERIPVKDGRKRKRREFPLRRTSKINEVNETNIRELRDISTALTNEEMSEIPLTSKRKIEEMKETTEITHTAYFTALEPTSYFTALDLDTPPY